MVETIKIELSLNELKLLLTALYSFEHQLEKKSTRQEVLLQIYKSEKFFNYDFDIEALAKTPNEFLSKVIGSHLDKLYEAYYDLASDNDVLKGLPPEDERITHDELFKFLDVDLTTSTGVI